MSRIGKQPVKILESVSVRLAEREVEVKGPRGTLKLDLEPQIEVKQDGDQLLVRRKDDTKKAKSLHGLVRTLIVNMIIGVTEGWSKTLKLIGTGYRVSFDQGALKLALGFSHPVVVEPIEGIDFEVKGNDTIVVSGIDKAQVGQVAARIRKLKPPEPYKGKGIRYEGEVVRRKPGKAAKIGSGFGPGAGE